MRALLAWLAVLSLCAGVGYRIATNPETRHPVSAGVMVAVLILAGVYLALAEHFDDEDKRIARRVDRAVAENMENANDR